MSHLIVPDITLHIKSASVDDQHQNSVNELRSLLHDEPIYHEYLNWCNDEQLHRFLIARQYHVKPAKELTISALKWRKTRIPSNGILDIPNWEVVMKRQMDTGKIFIPGLDQYHRPVIVMDNSVQNSNVWEEIQTFVAWSLDLACEMMPSNVDKYCVFFNLKNFSLFNCPPVKSCSETIFMLSHGYAERLGHLIVYKPPFVLYSVYNTFKAIMDAKTISKIHFITGDISSGSENDKKLCDIIGPKWRDITKAEYPAETGKAAGFNSEENWELVMSRIQTIKDKYKEKKEASYYYQEHHQEQQQQQKQQPKQQKSKSDGLTYDQTSSLSIPLPSPEME